MFYPVEVIQVWQLSCASCTTPSWIEWIFDSCQITPTHVISVKINYYFTNLSKHFIGKRFELYWNPTWTVFNTEHGVMVFFCLFSVPKHLLDTLWIDFFLLADWAACPNQCGKRYKYKQNLDKHVRYECGVAPQFKCHWCSYAGKQKSHLQSHLARIHRQTLD